MISIADLEKYNQALDKALIAYHGEKMREVNTIIKKLWRRTYKGKDIDFIEIRAFICHCLVYRHFVVVSGCCHCVMLSAKPPILQAFPPCDAH